MLIISQLQDSEAGEHRNTQAVQGKSIANASTLLPMQLKFSQIKHNILCLKPVVYP